MTTVSARADARLQSGRIGPTARQRLPLRPVCPVAWLILTLAGCGASGDAANRPSSPVIDAAAKLPGGDRHSAGSKAPTAGEESLTADAQPALLLPGMTAQEAPAANLGTGDQVALAQLLPSQAVAKEARAAFAKLLQAAEQNTPDDWMAAEHELHRLGASAIPALIDGLQSPSSLSRELAASFLAQLGPQAVPASDALTTALSDESPHVRVNSAAVLSTLSEPPEELIPILTSLLQHEDVPLVMAAAACVANLGSRAKPLVDDLEACLSSDDPRAQISAAQALGQLGAVAERSLPLLERLRRSNDASVREAARLAVQRVDPSTREPATTLPASATAP